MYSKWRSHFCVRGQDRKASESVVDEARGCGINAPQAQVSTCFGKKVEEHCLEHRALVDVSWSSTQSIFYMRNQCSQQIEDITLQKIFSKHPNVAGESSREHERLTIMDSGHVLFLDNSSDLGNPHQAYDQPCLIPGNRYWRGLYYHAYKANETAGGGAE